MGGGWKPGLASTGGDGRHSTSDGRHGSPVPIEECKYLTSESKSVKLVAFCIKW